MFLIVLYFIILCVLWFCIVFVLFCVLFFLLCSLFPISVKVHRPLPPGGNPIAVNNIPYNVTSKYGQWAGQVMKATLINSIGQCPPLEAYGLSYSNKTRIFYGRKYSSLCSRGLSRMNPFRTAMRSSCIKKLVLPNIGDTVLSCTV